MIIKYVLLIVICFLAALVYFKIAEKYNIVDKPNIRSSHKDVTLRGGGIIFLIGMWLYPFFFGTQYLYFITALSLISLISFVDDIKSVPNKIRLIFQFIAMFLMFYQWGILTLSDWWLILTSLILCVGIINAYNFMDGINGITGAYSLAVLVPLLLINQDKSFIDPNFLIVAIISVLIFNVFNFRKKAKCFAGDVGSIGIAFIILFALGKLIIATNNLSYILLLVIYGVDTVSTITHRLFLHENIFEAHRKHLYQIMSNELKIPHVIVSSVYMIIQFIISAGLIWLPVNKYLYSISTIIILVLCYIIFMKKYYHLHNKTMMSHR